VLKLQLLRGALIAGLASAFVAGCGAAALAVITSPAAPDDAPLPPLDLSRFNPQAQQLTGNANPLGGGSAWTSSLTVSCAPAYRQFGDPEGVLDPVFGAPATSGCASQQFAPAAGVNAFLIPMNPLGQSVNYSSLTPALHSAQSGTFHYSPGFSGATLVGRGPSTVSGGTMQVQFRGAGPAAATVRHADAPAVEAPASHAK
jgi:hypothetical protein